MNPENFFTLLWQAGLLACCGAVILAAAVLSVWGMFDAASLTKDKGSLKRGIKISSQPLFPEQADFLRGRIDDIIEPDAQAWQTPGFIRKPASEGLIYVSNRRIRRFRRLVYVGYINLNATRSMLEFRSSLSYHRLRFIPLLFVFPLAITGFLINFSAEKQAIEAFLREKMTSHSPTA